MPQLDHDDFAAHLDSTFTFYCDDLGFEVKLIEVSDLKEYPRQRSFSLMFLFPADFGTDQGNYRVEHSVLGSSEIFVVPVGVAEDGILFQAVFNRLLDNA